MSVKSFTGFLFLMVFFVSTATAQKTEITISLNEQFFDALLDGIYQNPTPIEVSIAANGTSQSRGDSRGSAFRSTGQTACKEVIQILRENNGVRTAVRFRDGKIYAPLAFSGNYNPPFVGCVAFSDRKSVV